MGLSGNLILKAVIGAYSKIQSGGDYNRGSETSQSYLFDPEFDQDDYIEQSGGFKDRADKRGIYIVKAGGEVVIPKRNYLGSSQLADR